MLMRVMWILRVLVIASAFVAIAYDLVWLKDPVGVFWESLLVLVNIVQLSVTYAQNRLEKFNSIESAFVHKAFPGLSNSLKRKILNQGSWVEADEGEVEIIVNSNVVGRCGNGDFIGELTVLSGEPATGTAITKRRTHYWAIADDELRRLVASNEEISQSVQACFHTNMLSKLIAANHQLQKAGGLVN